MAILLRDLVTDILLRLPVEPLLRFRCLSKSLCAEVDSADFVKNHYQRSGETNTHQKLIITNFYVAGGTEFYVADLEGGLERTFLPLDSPFGDSLHEDKEVTACGYCNGLILLAKIVNHQTPDLAVWNPFTRKFNKLPFCPVRYPNIISSGLGYDSSIDDYKVVIILRDWMSFNRNDYFQVWVFGLKSGSWIRSQDVKADFKIKSSEFANGALYWECKNRVLGFDLANEMFFDLPNPNLSGFDPKGLLVLRDNLYTCIGCAERNTIELHLDVSDKGGEDACNCWRKEFTLTVEEEEEILKYNFSPPRPLCFTKEADSILLKRSAIFWYNLKNKAKIRVGLPGKPEEVRRREYLVCRESLVSLGKDGAFHEVGEEWMDHLIRHRSHLMRHESYWMKATDQEWMD